MCTSPTWCDGTPSDCGGCPYNAERTPTSTEGWVREWDDSVHHVKWWMEDGGSAVIQYDDGLRHVVAATHLQSILCPKPT